MRVSSQGVDTNVHGSTSYTQAVTSSFKVKDTVDSKKNEKDITVISEKVTNNSLKEKVDQAISSINEFIIPLQTNSKFVLHEGLNEYYVRLVNSETEEVIKEIPPKKLLDAFYEMQKMLGMIVDEKI